MTIYDTCLYINSLNIKIQQNVQKITTNIKLSKIEKYHNSRFLKEERSKLWEETLNLMKERDFYAKQIENIEVFNEIEKY